VPAGYGYATRGPVGQPTNPGIQILLTIITFGIWALVWTYRQYRDAKAYSGEGIGGGLGLLLAILVGIVTYFLLPYEVANLYRSENQDSPVSPLIGFWVFLPLVGAIIWYLKVQKAINEFWVARGAAPV
jgi:hypothetical protein